MDQVRQLLAARRGLSRSRSALRQQRTALPRAAAALRPAITALEAQLRAIDRELATRVRQHPDSAPVRALQAAPGIGLVTATALVACLVDKQFTSADQFVAYVGLDLRVHASGQRRGQLGLSKHGDAELRRLLYSAALAATRSRTDPTLAERCRRERAEGLASTAALNAVARKLARLSWSLVTHQTTYDPRRVTPNHRIFAPLRTTAKVRARDCHHGLSAR